MKIARVLFVCLVLAISATFYAGPSCAKNGHDGEDHEKDRNENRGPCRLSSPHGQIQHVIYIQFDNTHFRRDLPNVPSDLEQMPSLLNFTSGKDPSLEPRLKGRGAPGG